MKRWYPYLASICDKMINEEIKYTSSDKMDSAVTTAIYTENGLDIVIEKENVRIGDMNVKKLFTPIIATFKSGLNNDVFRLIGDSPRGRVHFEYNGVKMMGFPIEIPQNLTKARVQEWKVMMHPDTEPNIESLVFGKRK